MASSFQKYSIGYVAENKALGSRRVNCIAVEKASAMDGEATFNPLQSTLKGVDAEGTEYEVKATEEASLDCEWLPAGSNRVTPPDVRRGELVEIYRLADTDQYYWRCMGLRDNLRQLETVIYAYNGSPAAGGGINFANCYYIEISTHQGHIIVGTSKANGEPFQYTVQINTKEGAVSITDDIGHLVEMDSGDRRIQLLNPDATMVKLERKVLSFNADEAINFTCGGTTFSMTPNSVSWKTSLWKAVASAVNWVKG
jgi:hypothetical protein